MPMIPETVSRCWPARGSAPRTPWSSAASPPTRCSARIQDCDARVVITADGGYRRGAAVAAQAGGRRGARRTAPTSRNVLVVRRTGQDVAWTDGRDVWWHDVVDTASPRAHGRGVRRRAPALRHVHLRHDRQAEGHPAHDRRLPDRLRLHALGGLRPQAGDRRLLDAPPTSAGSPATATSSTARSPTARPR